ncbi:hypothetical protein PoB_000129800 [Plakobranchus ocellatus]|uniref:Uncharacterized protein n=1 Tax=Plakobranchus ocellatus TaxID=259542 RepID=A0AAV3XWN9_9GAST|nr:hypothetical protein PoB_000129800 [Plakobranchus ocellatus]
MVRIPLGADRSVWFVHHSLCLPRMERGFGGRVDSKTALRSGDSFLSLHQAPLSTPWPDRGQDSMRTSFTKETKETPHKIA